MKAPFRASWTLMLVRGMVVRVEEGDPLFVACPCCPPLDASRHHGFPISVESRQLFEGVDGVRGVDVLIGMRQVASDLECSWCHRSVQCPSRRLNWSTDGFIISSCLFHTSAYIRTAMPTTPHSSTVQLNDQDRAYAGSTFREVVDALFANPYQRVWGREGEPPLPIYEVSLDSVFGGLIPIGKPDFFRRASERALDSGADLRWGPDGKGFRRLVHPNGLCLIGQWRITEETEYSGYFSKGSTALVDRPLLDLLHRDAARHYSVAVAWSASSFRPPTRTTPRRFGRPTSSLRRTSAAMTRSTSTTSNCATLPTRLRRDGPGRGASADHWAWCSARRQRAEHPPALPDRRARQAGGRADARARVHAPARRRDQPRIPGAISTSATRSWRRSSTGATRAEAHADVPHRSDRRRRDAAGRRSRSSRTFRVGAGSAR